MSTATTTLNLADLRVRRTRMALQNALITLLQERDFQAITVRDLTEQAMVNRATFYDHFVDKYALLDSAIRDWFSQILREKLGATHQPSPEHLAVLVTTACEFLRHLRDHCRPRMGEMLPVVQTQITTVMIEVLTEGGRMRTPSLPDSEIRLRATLSSWAMYGAALHWSQQPTPEPLDGFIRRVLPTIMHGPAVGTPVESECRESGV
jgi:AcrR family transcriptional regulator